MPPDNAERERRFLAVRSILITYGIAAYTYFLGRLPTGSSTDSRSNHPSGPNLFLIGLILQALLLLARLLVKRYAPDRESALQGANVLTVIGDGVTILLFAWGTLAATLPVDDA